MLIMHPTSYGAPTIHGTDNNIYVGKYTAIANSATFDGGMGHNHKAVSTYPFWRLGYCEESKAGKCKGDIHIGNDVWIGDGALIMSGVTIGDGAVIGARAVVRRNIESYEIFSGFRERKPKNNSWGHAIGDGNRRYRFYEEQIRRLLKLKWWDWPDYKVKENAKLLLSENIEEFLQANEGK